MFVVVRCVVDAVERVGIIGKVCKVLIRRAVLEVDLVVYGVERVGILGVVRRLKAEGRDGETDSCEGD